MRIQMANLLQTADEATSNDRVVQAFWTAPRDRNAIATIVSLAHVREQTQAKLPR